MVIKESSRGEDGARIGVLDELGFASLDASNINPGVPLLPSQVVCGEVQEAFSIGKQDRPAMRRVQRPVELSDWSGCATPRRHTENDLINVRGKENDISGPRTPTSIRCGRYCSWRASRQIQSLQISICKETNRLSVRGPEWELPVVCSWEQLFGRAVDGLEEQNLPPRR